VNNISISTKFSFLDGILAVKIPVAFSLYNDTYADKLRVNYMIGPRFIVSLHIKQYVEFNISPFIEMNIRGDNANIYWATGGNFGLALSSNLKRWAIRLEAFVNYPIPGKYVSKGQLIYGWGISANFNIDMFKAK
jgi:hypothetical protein